MEPKQYGLHDYYVILKRRWLPLFLPMLALAVITCLITFLWPRTYQSTATILIEEPEVPRDLVSSTVTTYADQRLQFVTQKVMTTKNLIDIIDRFKLYAVEGEQSTKQPLAQSLRSAISLKLVSADLIDPNNNATPGTIAFTLGYKHADPETAQAVLNDLVSLYLVENLRTRLEQAEQTTGFLTSEATKLDALVRRLESELADFKEQNAGRLPEQAAINIQLMDRTEIELFEVTRQIQSLDERKIFLQAELRQTEPNVIREFAGVPVLTPAEQLRARQSELISLQGIYGPKHPDVRKLSREIEALKQVTNAGVNDGELAQQLGTMQADLAVSRRKYSASHPDVVRLERQIKATQAALSANGGTGVVAAATPKPNNPLYIQLQAQLAAVNSDRRALSIQQSNLRSRLKDLEQRIFAAPQIERTYSRLQRDYENALADYQEVNAKKTAAQLGESLETERKGEQFSVIEPADLPLSPVSPNRRAILLLGFVFSISAGIGCAALFERLDQAVFGATQLAAITGAPPLIVVPHIRNRSDVLRTWNFASMSVVGSIVIVALGFFLTQKYLLPVGELSTVTESLLDYLAGIGGA